MLRGDVIGEWIVVEALDPGGSGTVYRCQHAEDPKRIAAVKVSVKAMSANAATVRRIAEALPGAEHPGICRLLDAQLDSRPPHLVWEYVEGRSLADVLAEKRLTYNKCVDYAQEIAEAAAFLHSRGVYHRDIRPANVIVRPDGSLCLVDCGVDPKAYGDRQTITESTFGAVTYAPPEWLEPHEFPPDQWDIYAVGIVLFEMLTGEAGFERPGYGSSFEDAMAVMNSKRQTLAIDAGPTYPPPTRAFVRDCTSYDVSHRPRSAKELVDRLKALPRITSDQVIDRASMPKKLTPDPVGAVFVPDDKKVARAPGIDFRIVALAAVVGLILAVFVAAALGGG